MDREGSIAGSPQHGTPSTSSSISSTAAVTGAVAGVVVFVVLLVTTTGGNGTAIEA